ncbi:MAG: hypothetical protein JZD41_05950 [Thermoproteus sp.]|nr:hypothetical protein [Thermoproteus sp.]
MSSTAYPSYPYGYLYPNEFAEPVIWLPTIFAYALLIAGAGLLILALAAYLFNRMARHVPLLLVLGISLFAPVLLGPLADLRAPDRAYMMMMLSPRIFPTEGNPGVSIIALMGAPAWPLGFVLAGLSCSGARAGGRRLPRLRATPRRLYASRRCQSLLRRAPP